MNAKKAKILRKIARSFDMREHTSYDITTRSFTFMKHVGTNNDGTQRLVPVEAHIVNPIRLSKTCVRGFYQFMKRNRHSWFFKAGALA